MSPKPTKSLAAATQGILGGRGEAIFPWARYWVPINQSIQMGISSFWGGDTDGFLADPEDRFLGAHAHAHLRTTSQLLKEATPGCFVLCGDPGMGKSRTLKEQFRSEAESSDHLYLEFRDIPTWEYFLRITIDSPKMQAWRDGNRVLTLVVDGVDEGLIKIEGFVSALTGALSEGPVSRLRLVLACRSLEWPRSEGARLLDLWRAEPKEAAATGGIFELCPLREKDVRIAAEIVLANRGLTRTASDFLREVKRHRLIGLGSRPLTLKMLLQEFVTGGGAFPGSHRELYRRSTKTLCGERDAGRRDRLRHKTAPRLAIPAEYLYRVAGRIAALLLLCGRSSIVTDALTVAETSDLTIDEIATGEEMLGETSFQVTPLIVEAALETPLFWPKTQGRAGFYHQTFAESLAAEYLGRLPFAQIRSLLFQRDRDGEHVHLALGELAAWMACESESLLTHLLAHDPEVLLRSDVTGIEDTQKAALVDAVLRKARAEELFDGTGVSRFFHTLKHPGLAAQLRATLHDRTANPVARRMALDIAESCRLEEMLDDAIALLCDPKEGRLHSSAGGALDELATPASVARLVPLLAVEDERKRASTRDRLMILHALLKHGHWTVSDAVPHIACALSPSSYSDGHILVQHAKPSDAEALLRGCLRWPGCFDSLSRFHPLVRVAYQFALKRIQEPQTRFLLARVWWQARRQHRHNDIARSDDSDGDKAPTLTDLLRNDVRLRLRFIGDLVTITTSGKREQVWLIRKLTQPEDFIVFLKHVTFGSKRRRVFYARLVSSGYSHEFYAAHSEVFLDALARSPELREQFPWMRSWVLNAADSLAEAARHYEREREEAEWEKVRARYRKPKEAPEKAWRRDLLHLRTSPKPTHWLTLAHNLAYHADQPRGEGFKRHDIQTMPGWLYHDDTARQQIIAGARRLILEEPGNPQHQMGGQSEFDHLVYCALFLLRGEIERTRSLADAVRRHWLPSIFDEYGDCDDHHQEMIALGYRLAPERMRFFLRDKILRNAARDEDYCLVLREFTACWDATLATFVIRVLVDEVRNPNTLRYAVEHLAKHDAPTALKLWRQLTTNRRHAQLQLLSAITAAVAGARLFEYWEELWPLLTKNSNLARRVFLMIERSSREAFIDNAPAGSESRLATLYLYMLELFPKREDPRIPVGKTYSPNARMNVARMRDELPRVLAVAGTEAAVDELQRIADALPQADAIWIRWKRRDALVALRRSTWRPPTPTDVLALAKKADRRWITDEDDLLAVVMESLARLNDKLRRSRNSWRHFFWEKDRLSKTKSGAAWRPVGEVKMAEIIVSWLEVDLAPDKGICVLRELQIQHDKRTDIEVAAVAVGANATHQRAIQIVIEVKGHWHSAIKTAHRDQLANDYLRRCGRTHGAYVIVWTRSADDSRRSKLKAATPKDAYDELTDLLSEYDGKQTSEVIKPFVLDAQR